MLEYTGSYTLSLIWSNINNESLGAVVRDLLGDSYTTRICLGLHIIFWELHIKLYFELRFIIS